MNDAVIRLHIGNRWQSHSGLNWYDNTARMHHMELLTDVHFYQTSNNEKYFVCNIYYAFWFACC